MQKITPFLWYSNEAEEAAAFYAWPTPIARRPGAHRMR
jgi:predicted 3-demethylubiquinone-9 3-methyltransferase (glyoxalase superfamily)